MPVPQQLVELPDCQENWEWIQGHIHDTGDMKTSIRNTDHAGWLLCDGRAITAPSPLRSLLGQLGNPFGVSGTDPKIPDAREKVLVGAGATHALGVAFGSASSNMPSHNHGGNTGTTYIDHTHNYVYNDICCTIDGGSTANVSTVFGTGGTSGSTSNITHGHSIPSDGSGSVTDGNYPPAVTINYFIRT